MLLAVVPAFVTGLSLDSFVPLRVVGLGRYASAPAIFLEEERGGDVLPVPIPGCADVTFKARASEPVVGQKHSY